jgi:SAM-dependent methyltransferase
VESSPPLPPIELMTRVGSAHGADPFDFYQREGAAVRARIEHLLPPGWTFDGKRVLDFGCGSARVLRHFLDEAPRAELWGCDIDGPSIDWVRANLSPPLRCFQNKLQPPLPTEAAYFDLVWATSVFTHIDLWSHWLLEMHRILAPGGLLIASWLGEGIWDAMVREPYQEDEVGITVLRHWQTGDAWVFHSEWWLREHWGRAFEVLEVARPLRGTDGSPQVTHSYIALRKRPGSFTPDELEHCAPSEPRELLALQTALRLLRQETDGLLSGEIEGLATARSPLAAPGSMVRAAIRRSPLADTLRSLRRRLPPAQIAPDRIQVDHRDRNPAREGDARADLHHAHHADARGRADDQEQPVQDPRGQP